MKRPLVLISLPFVGGILLGNSFAISPMPLLVTGLGLFLTALLWARSRPFLLWLLLFLTGWANMAVHTAVLSPDDLRKLLKPEPEIVTVRGILRETPSSAFLQLLAYRPTVDVPLAPDRRLPLPE